MPTGKKIEKLKCEVLTKDLMMPYLDVSDYETTVNKINEIIEVLNEF